MAKPLALALVLATLACMPIHYRLPGRGTLPTRGVLVTGWVDCGRGCTLYAGAAIQSIDGIAVDDAKSTYQALADGEVHRLVVESWGRRETTSARIRPDALHEAHFVGVQDLRETHPFGRDLRWGYSMASTIFYARDAQWQLPDDLLGQAYVIVDVPTSPWLAAVMIVQMRELADSTTQVFALRPGGGHGFDAETWRDYEEEALAALPRVHVVTTPWNTIERRSVYGSGIFFGLHFGPPNTFVIDCHGVVRWHAGMGPFSPPPEIFAPWLEGAGRMAETLVEDVETGQCWLDAGRPR